MKTQIQTRMSASRNLVKIKPLASIYRQNIGFGKVEEEAV